MPDLRDPNLADAGRYFGVACLFITWLMLGYGADIALGAKFGGMLSLACAFGFIMRAGRRGILSGLPFWPQAVQRDGADLAFERSAAKAVDIDVWFAQSMAGLSTCLLTLSVVLPLIGAL